MFFLFGFGHVTRRDVGAVSCRKCGFCGGEGLWTLCILRTWFTVFFIPVIPYSTRYAIVCQNCGGIAEISREEFMKFREGEAAGDYVSVAADAEKYSGKNPTQINYLKEMEEAERMRRERK